MKKYIDVIYKDNEISTIYIWDNKSPLKAILLVQSRTSKNSYFAEWLNLSRVYNDYAWAVIKQQPTAYIQFFIAPNFLNFLYPQIGLLENYDYTNAALPAYVKEWFGFDFDHLSCRFMNLQQWIIQYYPVCSLLITLLNWYAIYLVLKHYKQIGEEARRLFMFWCAFYFGYVLFSICSTVVLLRYMDPYFVIGLIMPFLLLKVVAHARGSEIKLLFLKIGG